VDNRPSIGASGLPASGKTTLAARLAEILGLPLFDKDDILEALFERAGAVDAAARQRLSRMSDDVLRRIAVASRGAVIVSHWRHERAGGTSGTPVAWLKALSATLIEVHCICPAAIAERRFRARQRHPSHNDAARSPSLTDQFQRLADLGPLGLGATISVRTDEPYDIAGIIREIRRHLD
jgi:shikimate kinase